MLDQIKIKNFKSWKELDIHISSITGLFGPNSSGKSSLLQFLLMLKQTKETSDRSLALNFRSSYINLGTFKDVIFNHQTDEEMTWSIGWSMPNTLKIADPFNKSSILFEGQKISLEAQVSLISKQLMTNLLQYCFAEHQFRLKQQKNKKNSFAMNVEGKTDFSFIRNQGRVWDIPNPIKSYIFPDQAKTYYQNAGLLSDFEFSYEALMDKIFYLGSLREHPKREYIWSGSRPLDVGSKGERVVDALLSARAKNETRSLGHRKKRKTFEEMIAYWLKELGLISEFKVLEIAPDSNLYKVQVKKDSQSTAVLITDVGFGISQLLPVLVLLYYVPKNSIVLLEHPEIHLHPAAQSGLADIIINASQTRNIQVIVESHSEHLLRRLQRRVAEEEIENTAISLYFSQTKSGKSKLTPLVLNEFGEINNWPQDFFGDEFGEVAATQKASLKRKIEKAENS